MTETPPLGAVPDGETFRPEKAARVIRVLHLEDDDQIAGVVVHILDQRGAGKFLVERYSRLGEVLPALQDFGPGDVMLLDLNLPDSEGWNTFAEIHRCRPDLPLVILTGHGDEDLAMRAVKEGGQDYLLKSEINKPGLLVRILHYAVERQAHIRQIENSRQLLQEQKGHLESALTSLKKTSAALVESEKIKSLGQMAAGIAHELKNPLAIIRMGLDYLNRAKPEKRGEAIEKVIPDLFAALSRADGIIADMMDYSAPRSLQTEMGSLNRRIEETLAIMNPLFAKKNIKVKLALAPALPELALDRQKTIHLLLNLMGNATQAMPDGGELRISTRTARMPMDNQEGAPSDDFPEPLLVIAEIHDSGTGIPEDILPRVFDPFFTTKAENGGTGLGLAVCNMIMELHGGKLELKNHPDGGALAQLTFIV